MRRVVLGIIGSVGILLGQPTVEWSTFLGSTAQDELRAVARAQDGSVVLAGWTLGVNFPVLNAWQPQKAGGEDAVVAKFSPTGSLLWATYFGGSGNERALGVALDGEGNVYVVGVTTSTDLPVANAVQSTKSGGSDAFVVKFSPSGQRLWATYYGGNGDDAATAAVVDAQGMLDVTGFTASTDFPTTSNAVQRTLAGYTDAFLLQLRPDGMRVWASYFGGTAPDYASGIAVDSRRRIYLCGETSSPNFPVRNAFQTNIAGGTDAFVASFGPFGAWNWSSYYGGSDNDRATAVTVTPEGFVTVVGMTASGDLQVTPVWQFQHGGGSSDAFVLQLSSDGQFRWASFLGGAESDAALGCASDPVGNLYVTGRTASSNFPRLGTGREHAGGDDLFVVKLHRSGMPQWSILVGGSSNEQAFALAVDSSGGIAFVGVSGSDDFPVSAGAYQTTLAGLNDGIIGVLGGYLLSLELEPLPGPVLCTGGSLWLRWRVRGGMFAPENLFVVELSDAGGSFQSPLRLDSLRARSDTAMHVFIPEQLPGGQYRLRVAATHPLAYSNDGGSFPSQPHPKEPRIARDGDTVFCEGRRVVFYVIEPQPGVHYRWWRDTLPVAEDALMYAAMESGLYTVEAYNACGSVRSPQSFRVTVQPLPRRPVITPSGEVRLCSGDTLQLRIAGEPGVSYLWFRNDTALAGAQDTLLRVWQAGMYTVEARNACESLRAQPVSVRVVPRPPKPVIGRRGDTLVSSALTGNQWLDENKQPIPGATRREFVPPRDGTYYVQVTVDSCSSISEPYVFVRSAVEEGRGGLPRWRLESSLPGELRLVFETVGKVRIRVVDLLGRCVWEQEAVGEAVLPSARWAPGIYLLQLGESGYWEARLLLIR